MDLSVSRHLWIEIEEPINGLIHWGVMCIQTMPNKLERSIRGLTLIILAQKKAGRSLLFHKCCEPYISHISSTA